MPPSTRQLYFRVGTGLLTASLSLASTGCKKNTVNVAPPSDDVHVNEGPEPDADAPVESPSDAAEAPAESPDAAATDE